MVIDLNYKLSDKRMLQKEIVVFLKKKHTLEISKQMFFRIFLHELFTDMREHYLSDEEIDNLLVEVIAPHDLILFAANTN